MKIEMLHVKQIKPYKRNPKDHPDWQIDKIKGSINEFGFNVPLLVDKKGVLIAGHGRYLAALDLQIDPLPVIRVEHLTQKQVKAFRIADNAASQSGWIDDLLNEELKALEKANIDLGITALDQKEIDKLLEGPKERKPEKPEVEFTEELMESSNYLVLYFDNDIDWLQALALFDLKTVKALDSKPGYDKMGVGRVISGAVAINKILEGSRSENIN